MRRFWVSLAMVFAFAFSADAQSKWPADKVEFDDAENLQQKFDAGDLGGGGATRFEATCGTASDGAAGEFCVTGTPATMLVCEPGNAPCGVGQWTDVAISGLDADSVPTLSADLNMGNFQLLQDILELTPNFDGLGFAPGVEPMWLSRPVAVGHMRQCNNTATGGTQNNACKSDADCNGVVNACQRNDGTNGTTGMQTAYVCYELTAFGHTGVYTQNNIEKVRFNSSADCSQDTPLITEIPLASFNREFSWNHDIPGQNITEWYTAIVENGIAEHRPEFHGYRAVEHTGQHGLYAGQYVSPLTGNRTEIGGQVVGNFGPKLKPGMRVAADIATTTGATVDVEGSSDYGGSFDGSNQSEDTGHFNWGVRAEFHHTQDGGAERGAGQFITRLSGANRFGACDLNSTILAPGSKCVRNEQCGGTATDGSNGICVHGDGVLDGLGTNDGVCADAATLNTLDTAPIFCDTTFGAQGTCDATFVCTDIQRFYELHTEAATGVAMVLQTEAPAADIHVWGMCTSTGGGSPKDEGVPCLTDADCPGTCNKEGGSVFRGLMRTAHIDMKFNDDRISGDASATANEFNQAIGLEMNLEIGGDNQHFNNLAGIWFTRPNITGTGLRTFNESLIRVSDQWFTGGFTQYQAPVLKVDAFTAQNSGIFHGIELGSWGWDTGNWDLGEVILWNAAEGTSPSSVDQIRVKYNSDPTASTDGQAIRQSSGNPNFGPGWGVSDAAGAALYDTGNKIAALLGETCADSDVRGSNGAATDCTTSHADGARFWVDTY